MKKVIAALIPSVLLASCTAGYNPDLYNHPTGYAHLDSTPISSPRGYDKTPADEKVLMEKARLHQEGWRNAVSSALMGVTPGIDMHRPVAVMTQKMPTVLDTNAAFYARDMLVKMSYIVALPTETDQIVWIEAHGTDIAPDMVTVSARLMRGDVRIGVHTISARVPYAGNEWLQLPGFPISTAIPQIGKPSHILNQD